MIFFMLMKMQLSAVLRVQEKTSFENYVYSVLSDSQKRWKEYPECPPLTIDVLSGLKQELLSDSAKYYFDKLKPLNLDHEAYMSSMKYFERKNDIYCLLAMTVHGNPDCRTYTMMSMYSRLSLMKESSRLLYESGVKRVMIRFLIYVLEYNPKFIDGSENSTIHDNYLSNVAWNLDLLTGKKLTLGKQLHEWYKNENHYKLVVEQWKEVLNSK